MLSCGDDYNQPFKSYKLFLPLDSGAAGMEFQIGHTSVYYLKPAPLFSGRDITQEWVHNFDSSSQTVFWYSWSI